MSLFDRYPECRRVIVNLKTGTSFEGVLWRRRRGYLVLRDAKMLRPKGEVLTVDGEVVVDAANVDWIQVT